MIRACLLLVFLWALLSGFTGTLQKNDGSAWEGITVSVVNHYTNATISSTTTAADGTYTLSLPSSGYVKLTFETSAGTRVRPDISLHVDAITSVATGAEAEGLSLTSSALDSLAAYTGAIPGSQVWGHTIKTQDEMVPPVIIRFDDFGAGGDDRYSGEGSWPDMITYAMELGLIPCIPTNTYLINQGGADADSLALQQIALKVDETGIRPEWMIHTNTNMLPGAYGEPEWNDGQWDQYYAWSRDSWVKELSPAKLVERINNISALAGADYRVTDQEIVGVVWPGDPSPSRRAFARRHKGLFASIFEEVGLEYGVDGYSSVSDSLPGFKGSHAWNPADATLYSVAGWTMGMFHGAQADKTALPMHITTDLTNRVVERGAQAKVPWAPASTVEWTLARETNYSGTDGVLPTGYTDATVSNFAKTVRSDYMWATAYNGALGYVFHPRSTGYGEAADTFTFAYPSSGRTNAALQIGDAVNSGAGTFDDPFDWKYVLHLVKELVDAGFFRNTSYTEQVRWLASKPGKSGLITRGFLDPINAAVAIGDTVGVVPMHLMLGSGPKANLSASISTSGKWLQKSEDADFDGKWESFGVGNTSWDDVTDPVAKLYLAPGYGNGYDPTLSSQPNHALCMWDDNGLNTQVALAFDNLLPGDYVLETTWQQAQRIDYTNSPPRLLMSGLAEFNRASGDAYGLVEYQYPSLIEGVFGVDADSWTVQEYVAPSAPAKGAIGATNFGDDTWPGAAPQVREGGWYTHRISFTVPEQPRSSNFDPISNIDHAMARRWRGHFQAVISPLSEDFSGGPGAEEHTRLGSAVLYWLGGP